LTEVDESLKNILDLVLEHDYFTRQYFAVGSVLSQEVIEAVRIETCVSSKAAQSLLLYDQQIKFGFIVLQDLLVACHLLGSFSNALPLKTSLLVNLTNLHEDHRRRKQIELPADE
jgi:hypothetical protein